MGKKGNWFVAVKKALSPESKEKKDQETNKSKKKWGFGRSKRSDPCSSSVVTVTEPPLPSEEVKLTEAEHEQSKHAYSVALATAAAAEAAVAAARAAAEIVRLATPPQFPGNSREEVAAIKIQTAFRGYMARRALKALRGLVRLKSLIHGHSVKRQATTTLRCMQTLARVQSQIRSRRIRMSEENQALQRQLLQKREKELENLQASMGDDWDASLQSKEQIEANLQNKQEAAMRRERAMAYAFSHQLWKNSSRSANPMFTDPNNPHWGWSWLERWMATRPWESRSEIDKEPNDSHASIKSVKSASRHVGEETNRSYARRHHLNVERPSPLSQKSGHHSPSTPPSKPPSVTGKTKMANPRGRWGIEDDSRSNLSLQSERHRRHSIAGSSVRDDNSLASSPAVPNYMVPTESARAKSWFQSPSGDTVKTLDRRSMGSAKKRLSFPMGDNNGMLPASTRRHSGPPKVDIGSVKNTGVHTENNAGSR